MYYRIKQKVFQLLHPEIGNTRWDKIINIFIIVLIILNVIAVMLETVESIHDDFEPFFKVFDLVSVIIFTIEYVLRVWSANEELRYRRSIRGRLKYMISLEAMIDLVAFLPYYVHVIAGLDLRMLRILRLMRFLRLFRLTAYMKAAQLVTNVFKSRVNELLLSLVLTVFLVIIASSLVFFAEHNAQPDSFSSIPATVWWAVVSLTTVGYGDMYPITLWGKVFTSFILLAGVAFLALPAGILTSGFLEEMKLLKKHKPHVCPKCGHEFHDHNHHQHDDYDHQ